MNTVLSPINANISKFILLFCYFLSVQIDIVVRLYYNPVSYTHLAVYKRQVHDWMLEALPEAKKAVKQILSEIRLVYEI